MADFITTPAWHRPRASVGGAIATLVVMAGLLCLDGRLGPLSFMLRRATALIVLISLGIAAVACGERRRVAGWAGFLAALVVLARAPAVPVALLSFVAALATIATAARTSARRPMLPAAAVQTCLTYVIVRFALDLAPQATIIPGWIAGAGSRYINCVLGLDSHFSFTALGGPPVALALLYVLWSWRLTGGLARPAIATVIPLGWFALLSPLAPGVMAGPLAPFWRGSLHGLTWLGLAVMAAEFLPGTQSAELAQGQPSPGGTSPRVATGGRHGRRFALAAVCATAALAGVCLVGTALLGPMTMRSILVHNRGGLDWDRPVFGRFGAFSGGMFGLLPLYCRAEGYDFGVIDSDKIQASDLEKAQILMFINSPKIWDERERQTILNFVARGGSLLVLGDHTDVFGLMRGFNSLLAPIGIKFRFDSAFRARETWRGCQAAAPDGIAWGWDDDNPGIAVGASLELSGSARPLLTGRYGFSDIGVRENATGSFLGNYGYDKGERLGDVVLVATTTYGHGRVVAWGDTTAFQGVASYYASVVGPMLASLSRPAAWTERPPLRVGLAAGLIAAILWLWIARVTVAEAAAVAVSLLGGLAVPWLLSLPNVDAHVHIAGDTVLVDRSHMPASGHYEARVNPVGPLYTNLLRSGFRTVDMDDWDSAAIKRARAIAFVAPQGSFARHETEELLRAEEGGTIVILNSGEPDSDASRGFLAAHGLTLAPRPMGTVTSAEPTASRSERESEPRFLDAWPIVTAQGEGDPAALPGVEVIYRHGDDVVALFRRVGQGGLLLIADTRFFSDMNVESTSGFWPGNLALIHDVFRRYLGADPDSVKPLFRSPDKPQ